LVTLTNSGVIGVMRFLQSEWHRHERDRNAWEIEKLEMKSRIATLEGQARRADATQKALNKYVTILQKKLKEQQAAQVEPHSGGQATGIAPAKPVAKLDRTALIQEILHCKWKELLHPSKLHVRSIAT
jgi:striatin 1/3/4